MVVDPAKRALAAHADEKNTLKLHPNSVAYLQKIVQQKMPKLHGVYGSEKEMDEFGDMNDADKKLKVAQDSEFIYYTLDYRAQAPESSTEYTFKRTLAWVDAAKNQVRWDKFLTTFGLKSLHHIVIWTGIGQEQHDELNFYTYKYRDTSFIDYTQRLPTPHEYISAHADYLAVQLHNDQKLLATVNSNSDGNYGYSFSDVAKMTDHAIKNAALDMMSTLIPKPPASTNTAGLRFPHPEDVDGEEQFDRMPGQWPHPKDNVDCDADQRKAERQSNTVNFTEQQ